MPTVKVPVAVRFEERQIRLPRFGRAGQPTADASVPLPPPPPPPQPPTAPTFIDLDPAPPSHHTPAPLAPPPAPQRTVLTYHADQHGVIMEDQLMERTCCCGTLPLFRGCLYIALAGVALSVAGFIYYLANGSALLCLPLFTLFSYLLLLLGFWCRMPWLYVSHVLLQLSILGFMLFVSLLLVLGGSTISWLGAQVYVNTGAHNYSVYGFVVFLCCAIDSYFVAMACMGRNQLKAIITRDKGVPLPR